VSLVGNEAVLFASMLELVMVNLLEEYIDHGENRDWRRRCSDRDEGRDRQESITFFGSERGLIFKIRWH
jgi:hypothetical protein